MRILVIVGQTTLLASLFIMLGFEFSLLVKGIPSAFILLCLAVISFLIGTIGLIVGCTSSFDSGSKRAEFLVLMAACTMPVILIQVMIGFQSFSFNKVNDVTTSVANPPVFNQPKDRRLAARHVSQFWNVLKIPDKVTAHPSLNSIKIGMACDSVVRAAFSTFHYFGWPMSFADRTSISIEAKASWSIGSRVNDFLVRVSPHEKGRCTVDLRSASRHKRRDMGMNVFLLNRFMSRFSKELNKERRERGLVYEDG